MRTSLPRALTIGWIVVGLAASPGGAAPAAAASGRPGPAVSVGAPHCSDGATRLCLRGRFEVEATWQDDGGRERAALAVPLASSGTGAFSLLDGENADLLVRVGEERGGGEFAVRAAALSGAAYELRIVDTQTGVAWTRSVPVEDPHGAGRGDFLVTDLADAFDANPSATERIAAASDHHLVAGRFQVRVTFADGNGHRSGAWAIAGGGDTRLFAATDGGEPEVGVRLVDGRAVNGHFWLLYDTLSDSDVEIELLDLASGNRRRFVNTGGSPTSEIAIEGLSASASVVHVTLDSARAVTRLLGPLGGVLEATDEHGTKFRLAVPTNALVSTLAVKLTPVATIGDLPFSGGLVGAAYIEPAGLVLSESALLTITPSLALPRSQQLTFAFRGLTGELSLSPPLLGQVAVILPVHRSGGYGLGAGTAADLAAQLTRQPSRSEDRFLQRLAGLILPPRRAGAAIEAAFDEATSAPAVAVPAGVLQLLQQEYIAIKPKILEMKQGKLERAYPVIRNWRNTAKDTGQTAKLPAQHTELRSAEIAGAVKSYNAVTTCGSVSAAAKMYHAYTVLKRLGAQGKVNPDKLFLCARFELRFDTYLDFSPPNERTAYQARVTVPLRLNVAGGYFDGFKEVTVNKETWELANCTTAKTADFNPGVFNVKTLWVSSFAWRETEDLLTPLGETAEILYFIAPAGKQAWVVGCPKVPPVVVSTSWSGLYNSIHLPELEPSVGFRALLEPSSDSRVFRQKAYKEPGPLPYATQDTLFQLFFGSAPK